ncbi:hypothetical protein MRX96_014453 [Rhipicephalus microplus]
MGESKRRQRPAAPCRREVARSQTPYPSGRRRQLEQWLRDDRDGVGFQKRGDETAQMTAACKWNPLARFHHRIQETTPEAPYARNVLLRCLVHPS